MNKPPNQNTFNKLFSGPMIISKTTYLSGTMHKKAALVKESSLLESKKYLRKNISERPHERLKGSVIASVILSTTFMEAFVNEFIRNALDNGDNEVKKLDNISILEKSSGELRKNIPVTKKYQLILDLMNIKKFNESELLFTNADTVRGLRNYFTHYKAKSIELARIDLNMRRATPVTKHPLEDKLKGLFRESQLLADTSNPFFPDKCLGAGCAEWAFKSVTNFVNRFKKKVGLNYGDYPYHYPKSSK